MHVHTFRVFCWCIILNSSFLPQTLTYVHGTELGSVGEEGILERSPVSFLVEVPDGFVDIPHCPADPQHSNESMFHNRHNCW